QSPQWEAAKSRIAPMRGCSGAGHSKKQRCVRLRHLSWSVRKPFLPHIDVHISLCSAEESPLGNGLKNFQSKRFQRFLFAVPMHISPRRRHIPRFPANLQCLKAYFADLLLGKNNKTEIILPT